MADLWGIKDQIEWDGKGPVFVDGREFPLAQTTEWCSRKNLNPDEWLNPVGAGGSNFPGFHFWVPLESGMYVGVWINDEYTFPQHDTAMGYLLWDRAITLHDDNVPHDGTQVLRVKGTYTVQPAHHDEDLQVFIDPWPHKRYKGRSTMDWHIAGDRAVGTPVEEFWAMLEEFGRYGKDPQVVAYSA